MVGVPTQHDIQKAYDALEAHAQFEQTNSKEKQLKYLLTLIAKLDDKLKVNNHPLVKNLDAMERNMLLDIATSLL